MSDIPSEKRKTHGNCAHFKLWPLGKQGKRYPGSTMGDCNAPTPWCLYDSAREAVDANSQVEIGDEQCSCWKEIA